MSELAGKLALITGAASGIGLSSARLFASSGADLALVDISENLSNIAKEIQDNVGSNVKITSHILDVTSKAQVDSLFKKIKELHPNHQAPNVILNSAGIARANSLINISEQEYDEVININLKGITFPCIDYPSFGTLRYFYIYIYY
jgi:NAD(P)-dependent dehydrogenase (short-subunit alcohol dehydrogenase family)